MAQVAAPGNSCCTEQPYFEFVSRLCSSFKAWQQHEADQENII